MNIIYKKQPVKYLSRVDKNTYAKIMKAIDGLANLDGDIVKVKGTDFYRLKIYHYRVIFSCNNQNKEIVIEAIKTRGDVY